ncbi:hypothetical protein [Bradyrhizobium japonicum]|uniref:hypothetical protein n=1 Tax=Bradyrhizobium japonicum TaxID=375 RepID=UPI00200DF49E|nr:hypothetical protein [Bradyrhizobium japonicum]UQD96086.1 hypothetical protein JEY30_31585 [Bradyrhizobium japonicum]
MSVLYDVPAGQSLLIQGPTRARITGAGKPAIGNGANVAAPALTSLNPNTAVHGAAPFVLHAVGTGFTQNCVINFDGIDMPTAFNSATDISTVIDGTAAVAGVKVVNVKNGPLVSGNQNFTWT